MRKTMHRASQFVGQRIEERPIRAGCYKTIPVHLGTRCGKPVAYVNLDYVVLLASERDLLLGRLQGIREMCEEAKR